MENRTQTVCLVILTTVAAGAALRWLAPVMIPFVLAVFFALILSPLIAFQESRLHFPRGLAVATTLLIAFLTSWVLASLVTASIVQLTDNADAYQTKATELLTLVAGSLPLERLGIDPATVYEPLKRFSVGTLGSALLGTTNAMLGILSNGILLLVFMLFLLLGSRSHPPAQGSTWWEIETQVKRYLVMKGLLSAATGLLVGFVLSILGIDLALVFGLFAFLLNFIPSVGSVIATVLPLPVVIIAPDISPTVAMLAIAVPGVIQFAIGNIIEPTIMGDSLDLHPVAIVMNLIIWGMLWGIVGMLLGTPILVVIKILCEKFEGTQTLAAVLAGRIDALRT